MRIRILQLPLANADTDTAFALIVDQHHDPDEADVDALFLFAEKIGAAGVFVSAADVVLDPPPVNQPPVEFTHTAAPITVERITALLRKVPGLR